MPACRMIGFNTHLMTISVTIRSAATVKIICGARAVSVTASSTKMIISLISCRHAKISPYMLLTSDVIIRWMIEVSAFR